MYMNTACLGKPNEDIFDLTKPLLVTAAGHYRLETQELRTTDRPHGRADYQLLYVAAGCVHFRFFGKEHILTSGNMVLFKPGEVQYYSFYKNDRPETYWVHFTGSDVEEILRHYELLLPESYFYAGKGADYQWLFGEMIRELQLKRSNYEELMNMLLRHIFLLANRYIKDRARMGSQLLDEIERAARYFNESYNKDIIIEDYARTRHMSPCWFIGSFKKIMKVTPMQYILSLRIANAMQLLAETDSNVSEASRAVGYEDARYFSRVFKRHTGISPNEYKRKNAK